MVRLYRRKKTLSALVVSLIAPIFIMLSVYTTTEVVTGDVASYYAHAAGVETSIDPASTTTTGTDSTLPTVLGATAGIATISGAGLYAFVGGS